MTTTAPLSISSFSTTATHHHHHHRRSGSIAGGSLTVSCIGGNSEVNANPVHLFSSCGLIRPLKSSRIMNRISFPICWVALNPDSTSTVEEDEEMRRAKIGARVRVKDLPHLKVYHVPKVPELDLALMEGELKQYVALWKGKRISANYPFKVQFVTEVEGRGPVKFFVHLREDEFDYVE